MEYFFPEAYQQIDWEKGYEFLDKELQKVVRTAIGKRRYVDKLVKVWLKNGKESWVLLHIEIQNNWEEDFSERIYIYQYRIFDRYKEKVATFVVLTDENPNWRPSKFEYNLLGTKQLCEYKVVKLLDYKNRLEELEQDTNPFSLIVIAQLKLQETKNNDSERYLLKRKLIRKLYEKGYSKERILELFRFIDWLIILPDYLEQQLELDLEELEKEDLMPFISRIERRWLEKGLAQGIEQGIEQGI